MTNEDNQHLTEKVGLLVCKRLENSKPDKKGLFKIYCSCGWWSAWNTNSFGDVDSVYNGHWNSCNPNPTDPADMSKIWEAMDIGDKDEFLFLLWDNVGKDYFAFAMILTHADKRAGAMLDYFKHKEVSK